MVNQTEPERVGYLHFVVSSWSFICFAFDISRLNADQVHV